MSARLLVVTGSRAEYGLLAPLLDEIARDPGMEASLLVTGAHLSPSHGMTVSEIEADGRTIAARVPLPLGDDSEAGVTRALAGALAGTADAIAAARPDMLVALGDRYESFAAVVAAHMARVPVAHLHGGESTLGATDDGLRHAMTKLATLHFTATEVYRRRVVQMGEDPARVVCAGALGVDNALLLPVRPEAEVRERLGVGDGPYAVVTFHPVTLVADAGLAQTAALLDALDALADLRVVLTRPNADAGNRAVRALQDEWVARNAGRAVAHDSLGADLFLNAVRYAAVVAGNSSSGVIEAPSLGTPTVDVGERQAGRERAASVLHADADSASIAVALRTALAGLPPESFANPYGDGHAAGRIAAGIRAWLAGPRDTAKPFFDLPFDLPPAP